MAKDNTVRTKKGIDVYQNDILLYADEYINGLDNPDDIKKSLTFTGMLKHIYINVFKPSPGEDMPYNSNSNIDIENIKLLDSIWTIYTSLCYRYGKRPTILNYCVMSGLDNNTIKTWANGSSRKSKPEYMLTAKKWLSECESALLDGATENNSVGCIFALKACYGYTETAPVTIQDNRAAIEDRNSIASRYIGAQRPDLPVIDVD